MKQTALLLIAIFAFASVFAQSYKEEDVVIINGVKWANRNVGSPGTFVQNPEDYGDYYTWEQAQTVCPVGYRVPTLTEMESLTNTTYVKYEWTTLNEVAGGKFTDKASGKSIFLPAAGVRTFTLQDVGSLGLYWSSAEDEDDSDIADELLFGRGGSALNAFFKSWRHCVRCVAE